MSYGGGYGYNGDPQQGQYPADASYGQRVETSGMGGGFGGPPGGFGAPGHHHHPGGFGGHPNQPGGFATPPGFNQFAQPGYGNHGFGGGVDFHHQIEMDPFGYFCPGLRTLNLDNQVNWSQSGQGMFESGEMRLDGLLPPIQKSYIDHYDDDDLEGAHLDYNPNQGHREWNNWVLTTFTPTGCQPTMTSGGSPTEAQEMHGDINKFPFHSQKIQPLLQQFGNSNYVDSQFPANFESIRGFGEKQQRADLSSCKWLDAVSIYQRFDVAGYKVSPLDVKQGSLGDCYFIAAISAVAEVAERARRCIISRNHYNTAGIHSVALCVAGLWEEITLDDNFPCLGTKPAFSQSKNQDLWVLLLEKAWAKVHGGYLNIESGYISEALFGLTGAPVYSFFTTPKNSDANWKAILEAERNNYIMCASSKNLKSGSDAQDSNTGLSYSHAYSLLSGVEVNSNGRPVRLVKLRNPWGRGEWKGEWSDNSPLWTPQLKAQLQVTNEDDGIFYMSWDHFQKYFNDFDVCYYEENFQRCAKKYTSSPTTPTVVQFDIHTPGQYYFSLHQTNKRMFRKADNYVYSNLSMIIGRLEGNSVKFVGSVSKTEEHLWFKANCQPGSYVAYIMTPWKRKVNNFSISSYGPADVHFQTADARNFGNGFLEAVMMEKAKQDPASMKNYAAQDEPNIRYKLETSSETFSYFYFDNKSQGTNLKAKVELTECQDFEFLAPYSGKIASVDVAPGQEKIVIGKITGPNLRLGVKVGAQFTSGGSGGGGFGASFGGGYGGY